MFGVLPAHWPLVLDAGTVLVSVPSLICAGFMYCHRIVRRTVLDNTPSKDSGTFCWRLLYSHYRGPYFHETEVKFSGYFRKTEPNEYMVEPLHYILIIYAIDSTRVMFFSFGLFCKTSNHHENWTNNVKKNSAAKPNCLSFRLQDICSCHKNTMPLMKPGGKIFRLQMTFSRVHDTITITEHLSLDRFKKKWLTTHTHELKLSDNMCICAPSE